MHKLVHNLLGLLLFPLFLIPHHHSSVMVNINSTSPHIAPTTPPTIAPVLLLLSSAAVGVSLELMSLIRTGHMYVHTYRHLLCTYVW